MKLKLFYVTLLLSFLTQASFAREEVRSLRSEKVKTYVGLLRHLKLSRDNTQNYFLFVSAKEVYRLKIPFHFKGVTLYNLDKKVEVKGVLVETSKESKDSIPKIKVKNMVHKR